MSGPHPCGVLVVARAPVEGKAKTRLIPGLGTAAAADLAAAALLDTLAAVRLAHVAARIVALTGDLSEARRGDEVRSALEGFTVLGQQGSGLAARLVRARRQAAALASGPVLQIGMDTPQVSSDLLDDGAALLTRTGGVAVLGPATDGGWWALGLPDGLAAPALGEVAMSRADTGARTRAVLERAGLAVSELPVLTDVDTPADAWAVADAMGADTEFRRAADRYRRSG
ncbi:MAG: TIGR04282 family arsenosugar biosynthesis glycosyltransferase [Acidimicrobiales bacterium]